MWRTPPLPPEPPPPDYRDVDEWFDENWERLKQGGAKNYIGLREHCRKYPRYIQEQEERWRAADRAEERVSQMSSRHDPVEMRSTITVWDGPPPEPEAEQLWSAVLDHLQTKLPRPTFETWLKPTVGVAIENGAHPSSREPPRHANPSRLAILPRPNVW